MLVKCGGWQFNQQFQCYETLFGSLGHRPAKDKYLHIVFMPVRRRFLSFSKKSTWRKQNCEQVWKKRKQGEGTRWSKEMWFLFYPSPYAPLPTSPNFLLTSGKLLRSPTCLLSCLSFAKPRKGMETFATQANLFWVLPDWCFFELDENTCPKQVTFLFWLSNVNSHAGSAFPSH